MPPSRLENGRRVVEVDHGGKRARVDALEEIGRRRVATEERHVGDEPRPEGCLCVDEPRACVRDSRRGRPRSGFRARASRTASLAVSRTSARGGAADDVPPSATGGGGGTKELRWRQPASTTTRTTHAVRDPSIPRLGSKKKTIARAIEGRIERGLTTPDHRTFAPVGNATRASSGTRDEAAGGSSSTSRLARGRTCGDGGCSFIGQRNKLYVSVARTNALKTEYFQFRAITK